MGEDRVACYYSVRRVPHEIDGSGTFVLWEVVRDALKPLFYPDLV